MRSQNTIDRKPLGRLQAYCSQRMKWAAAGLLAFAATAAFGFQDSPALAAVSPKHAHSTAPVQDQDEPSHTTQKMDLGENGPIVTEFAHLAVKIQQGVTIPAPRTQSKLLRLLPASTSLYCSLPNFGEVIYQANQIFHQELDQNTVLSDWWQKNGAAAGMGIELAVDQIHQFTGFLGDELVISGSIKQKGGSVVVIAEVKKPGLNAYLKQVTGMLGTGKNSPVQILTPQQLLTAKAPTTGNQFQVLVRSDFLVIASDLSTLRSVNAQINGGAGAFATSPFGERLTRAYSGGVGVVFGADLEQLMTMLPKQPQVQDALQQTGFDGVKYLIADGKFSGGVSSSTMELTFNGARKGIAAWLAPPTNLGGLDFVSADPIYAGAIALQNPAQMFDEIRGLAQNANPNASVGMSMMESQLGLNFRQDLFSKLSGQFAFALEGPGGPELKWKVIAQVSDPDGLQGTIKQLLDAANEKASPTAQVTSKVHTDGDLKIYSVNFYKEGKPTEISYAFVDGYLIVGSSSRLVKQAVEVHHNGSSLAKSADFHKLMPQEHGGQTSAVIFQNIPLSMAAMAQNMPPEVAQLMASLTGQNKYSLMTAYGEERAIRVSSNSQQVNMAIPLIVAAVAIPNLIRSKNAADASAAAATVRTLNTAQASYQTSYPDKGFASDLSALGPGPDGNCNGSAGSAEHACLVDASLGCASGEWCTKNGFQFTINSTCGKEGCEDYVALGTPSDSSKGDKSFCSTSDMIVRSKQGPPLHRPISVAECHTWDPL